MASAEQNVFLRRSAERPQERPAEEVRCCPRCGAAEGDEAAAYCAECGAEMAVPTHCPRCGAGTLPRADLCEACGAWLLVGRCCFCQEPVASGQAYCAECGNPPTGIPCPRCGKASIFDICPGCRTPLSQRGKAMAAKAAAHPKAKALAELLQAHRAASRSQVAPEAPPPEVKASVAPSAAFRAYRASAGRTEVKLAPAAAPRLFSEEQRAGLQALDEAVEAERERRRLEEERRRQEEERRRLEAIARREQMVALVKEILSGAGTQAYTSKQEVRAFFMAQLASLPGELHGELGSFAIQGWRCNAYGCTHEDGPSECADPSRGGAWVVTPH